MFRFADPEYFYLLLLAPVILLLYVYNGKKRTSAVKYSDISILKAIKQPVTVKFRWILIALRLISVSLLVVCLARPQSGSFVQETETEGIDIVITLDVSGTMKAEDFKPHNRLESAKMIAKDFIHGRKNDRIGLVVFSGMSFTQCPLTTDYGSLMNFIDTIRHGMIDDGTAIGMGIATAINRLRESTAKSKVIILLTDGQNNRGEIWPTTAAEAASALGIKIYAIGMGKEGGAPIPIDDPVMGRVWARNPDGSLIMEQVDEPTLKEVAKIANGEYFRATDEKKLEKIFKKIDKMEKTKIKVKQRRLYNELFLYFLIPCILVLGAEIAAGNTLLRKIP